MLNNRGSVSIFGMLLLCFSSVAMLIFIWWALHTHHKIRARAQLYLCFKYLNYESAYYVRKMGNMNKLIHIAWEMSHFPQTAAQGKAMQLMLQLSQDAIHVSYVKKLIKNPHCNSTQSSFFLKNLPYKSHALLKLKRMFDGSSKLVQTKWKYLVWEQKFKAKKSPLILQSSFQVPNRYSSQVEWSSKELSAEGLLSWKIFSL